MQDKQDFVRQLADPSNNLNKRKSIWLYLRLDPILFFLLLILTVSGLFILYSGSGRVENLVIRQATYAGMGYLGMFMIARINPKLLMRWSPWTYCFSLILLVLVFFIGVQAKGAQRWLDLGFTRFQPSEALKLALPIAVAAYFSTHVLPPKLKHVLTSLAIIFIPTILILKQPDLGTSLLIASSGLIVLYLAGLSWQFIVASFVFLASCAWPIWHYVLHPYQKGRILTLFNPNEDLLGAGWNSNQAKIAIGSGGVDGKGWLKGTQSQLDFLPESHTDFIIAVVAEEFGLIGVILLLSLYLAIVARGLLIACMARTTFNRLLAGGLILTFFVYVFVNVAMVSGLLPVVGVPLPLVSLGGTSLITLLVSFGILMSISSDTRSMTKY